MLKILRPINANPSDPDLLLELRAYRERMESEIEQARQLQLVLLPNKGKLEALEASHQLAVSNFFQPATTLAGDSWDIWPLDERHIAFYMSDFTGHGVGSAIQSFRLNTLIAHASAYYFQPSELLGHLNHTLKRLLPAETFCTFFYGILDVEQGQLAYASAGAPCPYLFIHREQRCEALQDGGIPLGIVAENNYVTCYIAITQGDTLCLYSDALVESPSVNAPHISEHGLQEKLARIMQDASVTGQRLFMRALLKKLHALDGMQYEDDLTVTLITQL